LSLYSEEKSIKKKSGLMFFILAGLSISIIISDVTLDISSFRNFFGYLLFPSQKVFSEFFYKQKDINKNIKNLFSVYEENKLLKEKIKKLEYVLPRLDLLSSENEKLKSILEYKTSSIDKVVPAQVVGRSIADWYRAIIIDKGLNDGVRLGCPVILGEKPVPYLVGQIIEVNSSFSKVLLITDSNSSISGYMIFSGLDGIVQGANKNSLIVKYVSKDSNVKIGDTVVSSGLGGVFPYGFYIGVIEKVKKNSNKQFQDITIKTALDLERLHDVFVVIGDKNDK
jgi:rod shape-determining protein MreC